LRKADLTTEGTKVFTEGTKDFSVLSVKTFVPSVVKYVFGLRPNAFPKC